MMMRMLTGRSRTRKYHLVKIATNYPDGPFSWCGAKLDKISVNVISRAPEDPPPIPVIVKSYVTCGRCISMYESRWKFRQKLGRLLEKFKL